MPIIHGTSSEVIHQAVELLKTGTPVALPTETVYGLAANACDPVAVKKIFELKQRPQNNPLIIHLANAAQIEQFANPHDERCYQLTEKFWPGPLSIILKKRANIPDIVSAGKPSVAMRSPNHPLTLAILEQLNTPLAAPSANPFTYVSPTCAQHVIDSFRTDSLKVVDGGPCRMGIESTIIDLSGPGNARILRLGPITQKELEETLDEHVEYQHQTAKSADHALSSPGQLSKHYQPHTPVFLRPFNAPIPQELTEPCAIVHMRKPRHLISTKPNEHHVYLSESGLLSEVASHLYHCLRTLDKGQYKSILMELAPNEGLGQSINDRLLRAGKPR